MTMIPDEEVGNLETKDFIINREKLGSHWELVSRILVYSYVLKQQKFEGKPQTNFKIGITLKYNKRDSHR